MCVCVTRKESGNTCALRHMYNYIYTNAYTIYAHAHRLIYRTCACMCVHVHACGGCGYLSISLPQLLWRSVGFYHEHLQPATCNIT